MPPLPGLKILTATMCSAVRLLVESTVVKGRELLGPQRFFRDVPRFISAQ